MTGSRERLVREEVMLLSVIVCLRSSALKALEQVE